MIYYFKHLPSPINKRVYVDSAPTLASVGEIGSVIMTKHSNSDKHEDRPMSNVSSAFVQYNAFLKKFLSRFFTERQDIEDVAQEAYLRAYVAEQKKDISQPKAYLFRIARNIALAELTKKSRRITRYVEDLDDSSVVIEYETADKCTVEAEVEAQESLGLYCDAVAALPEKCRQVFLLRKVHGLGHKEIGARLSLSVSSVEKYLRRGVLTCRALVDAPESVPSKSCSDSRRKSRP